MLKKIVGVFLVLSFVSGCAVNKMEAQVYPDKTLEGKQEYYVAKLKEDGRGINTLIASKLNELGKSASTGESTSIPETADVLVTYSDKWMWDITMYMIELTVIMREPSSEFPIAKGYSMHTSLTRKSPEEMVDEVLTNIFKEESGSPSIAEGK
jgi:hypothetical protein